ncbi:hypothetical protein PQR05_29685 [Paraburkholderia sediminicola]|uniref:hypothetical protein n=1 Tax=Paraburkholderia sediminicola TaxID=458836 RepID=UPI0038B8E3AD
MAEGPQADVGEPSAIAFIWEPLKLHHSFDTEHARLYGLPEAVLVYNLQFWIERNRANGENFREGRTWSYNSVRAFGDLFAYLSIKQVRRALESLVKQGVLVTANHNESGRDRTLWYAFTDEDAFLAPLHHLPESANASAQAGNSHSPDGANGKAQTGKSLIRTDVNADRNPDGSAASRAATKGARIPDDWKLPRNWGMWAKENPDLPGDWTDEHIRRLGLQFHNYWKAKSGRDAVKRDWFATWQNWCLNPSSAPGTASKGGGAWWLSPESRKAKARENNVGDPLPGESDASYQARIQAAIDNGGKPPAPRPMPVTPLDPVPAAPEPRARNSEASRSAVAGIKGLLKTKVIGGGITT